MRWPKEVYYFRHFESAANATHSEEEYVNLGIPTHAVPLSPLGERQGPYVASWAARNIRRADTVLCSQYRRTQQSAKLVYPDAHLVIDERLNELNRGVYYVMTTAQVYAAYPGTEELRRRCKAYFYKAPLGEHGPDVHLRQRSMLDTWRREYSGQTLAVFGHATHALLLEMLVEGHPPEWFDERVANDELMANGAVLHFASNDTGNAFTLVGKYDAAWKEHLTDD